MAQDENRERQQGTQEPQEKPQVKIFGTPIKDDTPAEEKKLQELTLAIVEALPKEKQDAIWNDFSTRWTDSPAYMAMVEAMKKTQAFPFSLAANVAKAGREALSDALRMWKDVAVAVKEAMEPLFDAASAFQILTTLAPYIAEEHDENPDEYTDEDTEKLIQAAAARAKADGKQVFCERKGTLQQGESYFVDFDFDPQHFKATPTKTEPDNFDLQLFSGGSEPVEKEGPAPTATPEDADGTNDKGQQTKQARQAPIEVARERGAITTLGGRVATVADGVLHSVFTSKNIKGLPGKVEQLVFDDEGKLNIVSLNGNPLQELNDIQTRLQMALFQIANLSDLREYNSHTNSVIGIYLPAFFREAHIDPRQREHEEGTHELKKRTPRPKKVKETKAAAAKGSMGTEIQAATEAIDPQALKYLRRDKFVSLIKPLENRVGNIPSDGWYRDATFQSWDEKTEIAYITTPFSFKLAELLNLHSNNPGQKYTAISNIFHASIMTENDTAVELANRIAVGVIERGITHPDSGTYNGQKRKPLKKTTTTTDATGNRTTVTETYQPETIIMTEPEQPKKRVFTFRIRFDTLIDDCPLLRGELENIRNSTDKNKSQKVNKKLKDTFDAAIRIIMKKSEAPMYYANLAITTRRFDTFKAPTNSTLKESLVVTHTGKNPDFTG